MRLSVVAVMALLAFTAQPVSARQVDDRESLGCVYDLHDFRGPAPRFASYPAPTGPKRRPAAVDLRTDRLAPMFRTRLREGARLGPNFAGHYRLVSWGAGFANQMFAIVDTRTGKVTLSSLPSVYFAKYGHIRSEVTSAGRRQYWIDEPRWPPRRWDGPAKGEWGSIYWRKDSRLLVLVGSLGEDETTDGVHYMEWDGKRLKRVKFVPAPCAKAG